MATVIAGHSPSTSSPSPPSSPALFATDIANNVVELKNVVLNEFHVLRKFLLKSTCDRALRVSLDSDLSSQIGFQLNNENIDNADEGDGAESTVATFLADDFNELFNTVNLVNEVILQPRQIQQVIITFRPLDSSNDATNQAREFKGEQHNMQVSSDQKIYDNGSGEPSSKNVYPGPNQTFKVNGRLFLSAKILPDEAQTRLGTVEETSMDNWQDIVVQFYSTICRCILRAEVTDMVFDDCVPGVTFVKDFSVRNLSEIACAFQIHVKNGQAYQAALDLIDYNTKLPVTSGEIKNWAHRRIRVMFKSKDVGEFSYSIHLENSFDARNSTCIPVHCIVSAEHRQEGLLVTGVGEDGVLDFGDCYSNFGTCQMMTIRNITHEALVVKLGTDPSPGDQVNFYLQTELDIPSASGNGVIPFMITEENETPIMEVVNTSAGLSHKLGDSLGASVNFDKKSRVEVLSLERSEEKNLLVGFYPAGALAEAKAVRLQRRTFRLSLTCEEKKGRNRQRFSNIIQCKARICTSIVKLSAPELNFGDCNIGCTKPATFEIVNLSDLPAIVTSCVTSKILSFKNKAEKVPIPPRQSYVIHIDLVPLKINLNYRKQITIDNFYNKDNHQVLEVRGKIMDRHHVLLHSLYYKLRTPSMNNILNFDCVIVNNPSVRILAVDNITDESLTLGFNTSMPEELGVYQLRDDSQSDIGDNSTDSVFSEDGEEDDHESRRRAYAASVNKEKLLETLEESQPRLSKAIVDSAPFPVQQGHRKAMPPRPPFTEAGKKTRMRMSLDLATSGFASNGGDKAVRRGDSLSGSDAGDGEVKKELLGDGKTFSVTAEEHAPRPLKRVQSSAMLSAIEEAPNVVSELSQEEVSPEGIEEVLKRLGNHIISQSSFPDEEAEKQYVDNQIKDRELLMHVLEDLGRALTPVRKLELLPGETKILYVLLTVDGQTRPSLQGRLQKLSAKVSIQLLDYNRERQHLQEGVSLELPVDEDLPTRELPVHFKACRALLSLAQKNISFGKLLTNDHRAKILVLNNISDVPLLYKLKKTGSIASGDLHIINGKTGILLPHSDREVNFVFQPSLGGPFRETLVVGNVYDPSNDQVVTLKATISRADTFWLKTSGINFGTVFVGVWSKPQSVVIENNSKQSRTYMLEAADYVLEDRAAKCMHDGIPVLRFLFEEKREKSPESALAPEEEAIEALERKGISLERKGKADKAAKIRKQISELRARVQSFTPKKIEALTVEGSKMDKTPVVRETNTHLYQKEGQITDPDPGHLVSSKSISKRRGSDGYISLNLKGGDSKTVLVRILVSLSTPGCLDQRIGGTLVAYESRNQDVVKKVYYEAITCQQASFRDAPGGVTPDTFNLKLQSLSGESPHYPPLSNQSASVSPESSAPTSPYAYTTQSSTAHNPFRSPSPDLSSNLPLINGSALIDSEVAGYSSASSNLATSLPRTLGTDGWGSKQHILDWSKDEGEVASDDVFEGGVVDEDESSRSESGTSGLFGFDPLFKIDLLQQSHEQAASLVDPKRVDDELLMDLSSAAALARSLVSHKIQEEGKTLFAGEVSLDDSSDGDKRKASFLIKSESQQDISIQFHLSWEGKPDRVELWVSSLGEAAGVNVGGKSLPDKPRQLRWERSEYMTAHSSTSVSSMFLKGGTVSMLTLICPDQQALEQGHALGGGARISASYDGQVQATGGVLTMQARPDDGLKQRLLVRLKQLERCIKVSPAGIVFPESELTAVLRQDFIIKNRTGTTLTYKTRVTETIPSSVSPTETSDKALASLAGTADVLARSSSGVPDAACDSVVTAHPASGHLEGHASVSIKITCRPVRPGKKSYILHVKSSSCLRETQVGITTMPARAHYLHLPDLPDGAALDMGSCFINAPSRDKVVPLRLQNLANASLLLSFKSNLAKQVYISLSATNLKRTDDLELPGGASSTVFMCLRPGGDAAAFEGGQCRPLVGGMRITARALAAGSANQEKVVDEIMVKFSAILGRSLLQVSASMIDLGRIKEVGGFVAGDFLVSNPSSQLALHFSLASKLAQLSVPEGYLAGKDAARLNGDSAKCDMTVKFSLPVSDYGLIEDKIVVQNLSCPGQNAELVLRLFVDGGVIKSHLEPAFRHFQPKHEVKESPLRGPELPPVGMKPGLPNRRPTDLLNKNKEKIVTPASNLGAGIDNACDRKIRKALSAGDFSFANLTSSIGTTDRSTQQQQNVGVFGSHETPAFLSNSFLDLGTVFVSPNSRRKSTRDSPIAGGVEVPIYAISDLRPYHSSLFITNLLQEPIELQAFSNLKMLVESEKEVHAAVYQKHRGGGSFGDVGEDKLLKCSSDFCRGDTQMEECSSSLSAGSVCEDSTNEVTCELVTKLVSCGPPIVIQPFCTTHMFVSYSNLEHLSSSDFGRLTLGKTCTVEGMLVFIRGKSCSIQGDPDVLLEKGFETKDSNNVRIGHQAVEVLNITGSICQSEGKLEKEYVDLGKVGYANRWADVQFDIALENSSDAVLVYQLVDVPECFVIHVDELGADNDIDENRGHVAPRGSCTLCVDLCTSKLEHKKQAGPCSWRIRLLNCNNPNNLMELVVEAEMTVRTLRFGGLTEGALLLPSLTLPSLPSALPCTMPFVVENLSMELLGVVLRLQQAEETESLVMLESTTMDLPLEPGEKFELRISARPISDIVPSHFLAQGVPSRTSSRTDSGNPFNSKELINFVSDNSKDNLSGTLSTTEAPQVDDMEQTSSDLDSMGVAGNSQGLSELASTVCFGQLYLFSSPHLPDCIPIHGALLQGSTFDVSPHNLYLQARIAEEGPMGVTWKERHGTVGSSQIIVVRNFRAFEPLQFAVLSNENEAVTTRESPFHNVSVQPLKGSIPARGSAEIVVKSLPLSREAYQSLANYSSPNNLVPETLIIALFVKDAEGQESERSLQRILINIHSAVDIQGPIVKGIQTPLRTSSRKLSLDKSVCTDVSLLGQAYKRGPLVLGLRGCTPVRGSILFYEIICGQQNISSGGCLHWGLTLIGDQNSPIHYRLSTNGEGYASWLSISSSHGIVEAAQQNVIQLSFSTKAMGVYSTYLVVENLDNPADIKTVHLSLEVVAPRNTRPEAPSLKFFHVLVQGDRAEGTVIDMGEVCYNFLYRNRSFVVVNEAPVAMEFLLSSSLDKNGLTELNFSLANTLLKPFSSVTVGAKSSVRVWIYFCPAPLKERPIAEDADIMSANIFVNCRLVKDHQLCIPFRAKCRYPQISISPTDIVFSIRREGQALTANCIHEDSNGVNGKIDCENVPVNSPLIESIAAAGSTGAPVELAVYCGHGQPNVDHSAGAVKGVPPTTGGVLQARRDDAMELLPAQQSISIQNLSAHRNLEYVVKNDSLFFTTDVPESQIISSCPQSPVGKRMNAQSNGSSQPFHEIVVRPNMESLVAHQKSILNQKYVEEHLSIYNRSNPREKYTVSLRITAGHLRNFFDAPGPFNRLELLITGFLSNFYSLMSHILAGEAPEHRGVLWDMRPDQASGAYSGLGLGTLEKQGILTKQKEALFQGLEKGLESCVSGGLYSTEYDSLFFDFHYLTDELTFYCLKERWSRGGVTLELATVQLAKLLYCALYRCKIFQVCVDSCQYFSSNVTLPSSSASELQTSDEAEVVTQHYSDFVDFRGEESRPYMSNPRSEFSKKAFNIVYSPKHCLKFLEDWTGQLRHFLSFSPDSREDLISLRELSQKNLDVIITCRAALR